MKMKDFKAALRSKLNYIEKNLNGHRNRIRLKNNYDIASFESVQTQNLSFDTGHVSPFGIF